MTSLRRIERNDLRVPARVLDLELADGGSSPGEVIDVRRHNSIWCLSRSGGVPREISFWDVSGDDTLSVQALRDQLRAGTAANSPAVQHGPSPQAPKAADLTVVICTRDRPEGLRATLTSLHQQTEPEFSVVVVDNNPSTQESRKVVEEVALPRCEYVLEPRPGLSRARNRGLGVVGTELVAWIDDDETADPNWVRAVKQGFAHGSRPAAVCGVMLPAELEHEAQVRFEQYGGFNKGRGMTPEVLRAGTPSVTSPLYPLPAFGAGGNMAFRTESLVRMGGFDPHLGAGTRTHGCEETRALSLVLSGGDAVLHWPAAVMWHTHRRDMAGLRRQFYGYSAGASAFYVSMIKSRPAAIFDILRLFPHALRDFRSGSESQRSGHLPGDFPAELRKAARRGLLDGPFMYAYEVIKDRRHPATGAASREGPLAMLPTRELAGTGITTTAVGFGCAGLFRIPQRAARRLSLDVAYDAGIRHYDVAPMYGLGLAEAELAPFLKGRRAEVTVTTKFGIDPTLLSKGVARVQRPARVFLARRPAVGEELKAGGQGPRSGTVGRLLYAAPGYDRRSARLGLERSLRELRTDYIDVFLLHDPVGSLITGAVGLVEYLEEQRRLGRIRAWGVTGPVAELPGLAERLGRAPVAQFRDDILERPLADQRVPDGARVTYGALSRALSLMRRYLAQSPDSQRGWSDRLGADLAAAETLPALLLNAALRRNPAGPVLFTTTRPERVGVAATAANQDEGISAVRLAVLSELAAAARTAGAELIGTS